VKPSSGHHTLLDSAFARPMKGIAERAKESASWDHKESRKAAPAAIRILEEQSRLSTE
jgi:hypothetical protein